MVPSKTLIRSSGIRKWVSTVGGHLLCEGADNLSGDVQEENGSDEGQC